MTKSNSLIFFGNERLSSGFVPQGAPTLQALIDNDYDVKAIVAHHEDARSRKSRTLEIEEVAKIHNIPVLLPDKPKEIIDQLASLHADAGVLVAYGRIIPQSVIDLFPYGILNIHPSLLPRYRGSTPIEQAILDGVTETGVSIMSLVKEMDAGPIFAQERIALNGDETKQKLTQHLLALGSRLIVDVLPGVLSGTARPQPQSESKATFTSLFTKADGNMDLSKPAEQLEREVRAYAVWPKSRLDLHGHHIVVTKVHVAQGETAGKLVVRCNPGYLEILELTAPSGKHMTGGDFKRGYLRD